MIMSKLMPGKTLADFQKAAAADGPPTAGLTYVFACFMPDKNGKPHVMSGMVKEVKIAA